MASAAISNKSLLRDPTVVFCPVRSMCFGQFGRHAVSRSARLSKLEHRCYPRSEGPKGAKKQEKEPERRGLHVIRGKM